MKILYPLIAVLAIILLALIGAQVSGGQWLFGVVLPYVTFAIFLGGFIYRVTNWGKSPVPFRIPTTCGQAASLPWIKQDKIDDPSTLSGVLIRMALEVFLFRSLFRNTKAEVHDGPKLVYGSSKYLWLFGLMFHYSFLVIVIRHLRLFTNPVPSFVQALEFGDGIMQLGVPVLYQSGLILLLAVTFLFVRRVLMPQIRYISLANDYFPLLLIFGIASTGILMRYFLRVDIDSIKKLLMGLVTFSPQFTGEIGSIFFIHVALVCTLMAYFPFSKLMHLGGVFMSPTRNLANNSRSVRHVNPWNDPNIKPHSYAGYEDDFREFMVDAGLPVEKELPPPPAAADETAKE
ncbi:MAG: sulfate reduction electron transfer complex DsrMKJOP subunit DsrM [Proteobacteria bacterium]|nr:sulfate reduction electron transfer complex DsrMKJOP subunit DsrM [Pseudomonadota bacterium]MBU1710918.1 sulfate reduction electron transfer complex DsrMKJOP subunit DsrM [Pseudomonadota bacterium]